MPILLPTNILVPIDFSETSELALDYAIELAAKLGAKVHVINAVGVPMLGVPELGLAIASTMIDEVLSSSQVALQKLVDARRSKATFGEVLLRSGDARDVILHAVEEVHAQLIVMGTHGRRGISRALIGSVAESVVRSAPCPVLTIHGKQGKS